MASGLPQKHQLHAANDPGEDSVKARAQRRRGASQGEKVDSAREELTCRRPSEPGVGPAPFLIRAERKGWRRRKGAEEEEEG